MNVLDPNSAIEPLAFDHVSFVIFTIVNNLWTWIALITAAISFWRIKSACSGAGGVVSQPPLSSAKFIEREPVVDTSVSETVADQSPCIYPASARRPSVFDDDGVTKGKFVVYYYEEENGKYGDNDLDGEGDGEGGLTAVREWTESWERVVRMRMGEMGWYRYQDLRAINGNVVRLWDGARREQNIMW